MDTVDRSDETMKPLQIEGLVAADLTGEESKILVDQVAQRHLHTQSCHSPWSLTSVYFINNETLNSRYREKKAAMEKAGCTETQLEDTFVFTYFKEESALQDVVNNGLGCRQTKFNILGNTGSGVYVCKHADVQQRIAERTNPETYLITVYKLMLGRTLEVEPSSTGQQMMSPTLGYDCHVSTQAPQATDQLHKQFLHSQLYVYDLDEAGDALSQPQQLVPQAVLMYSRHSQAPASPSATAVDSAETSASDMVELDIFDSLLASAISEHFDHVQPELPTQPTNEQLPETEITIAIPELPNQPTNEQRPETEITVDIPNVGELPTLDASDIQLEGASGDASLDATKSSLDNIPHMLDASDIQLEGASEDASLDATKSSLDSIPHMLDESKTSIDSIPAGSPLSMMSPALQTSSEEDINSKMEDALAVMAKICSDDSDIGGTPQHSADSQLDQAPHLAVLSQQDEMPEKEKESMPLAEPVVSKDVELTLKKLVRQIECGRTLRVKIKRLKVDRKVWDIPSKGKMKKSKSERDSLKESNKIGPKSKQNKTSESKVSSAKKNTDKKKVITKNKDTDRKEFKSKILISSSDSSDDSGSDDDGMDIKSKINRILSRHSSDKIRSKVSKKKKVPTATLR